MSATPQLTELKSWHGLVRHASELARQPLSALAREAGRFERMSFRQGSLLLDLSRQRLNRRSMELLVALAQERNLDAARAQLFADNRLNATEGRAVLHTALRAAADERPPALAEAIEETLQRMRTLTMQVRGGEWRGHTGKTITDIVHIGIGGSWLGPALVVDALQERWTHGPEVHFLANVDALELERLLARIDPERTLCIIASKSFSTIETRVNALSLRSWYLERGIGGSGLARHFVAVSSNVPAALEFGIAAENILPMWDSVGGRYSVWSAIGLPIALRYGFGLFTALLEGARAMDQHFHTAPLPQCLPFLLGATEVWNLHFQGADSHVLLCYDHRLKKLPDFLQQLEMESNGKHVRTDGTPVQHHTAPIVWGGEGTNGQHSFHQLLHQGTRNSSCEFILCGQPDHKRRLHTHWLHANAIAQGEALAHGKANDADLHREVHGGHPSSCIVIDELTPASLGALLALYEHKTFTQSVLWGINAFDQFGVELGKHLATDIEAALRATPSASGDAARAIDATSRALVDHLRRLERNYSH